MGRIPLSFDEWQHPERHAARWAKRARRQRLIVWISAGALAAIVVLLFLAAR